MINNTAAPEPDMLPGSWTSEGVLFSAVIGESANLWRVKISQPAGTVVENSLERLTDGVGSDGLPSTDAAGRIVFRVGITTNVHLTIPLDPNAGKVLGPVELQATDGGAQSGRSSLDDAGQLLVYPKARARESEIWVKNVTTGEERHVATTAPSSLNPLISHDGTKVAYTVPEVGSVSGYVIGTRGGTAKKVCADCSLQGWLADDRRMLVIPPTVRAPGRVSVLDTIDGKLTDALVDADSWIGRVDVSPDGRWLAVSAGEQVLITRFTPGTPPAQREWVPVLTTAPGSAERGCGWSPDSRLFYLLLERDGFRDLYAQRIDPRLGTPEGEPFLVQHFHDPRRRWGSTPYGNAIVRRAFVFYQFESTSSIWMMTPRKVGSSANDSSINNAN
jgi:hypothetical protein